MGTLNQKNKNKQDDETEIDLGKLFKALVQRLPIILLVTLCFSAIGFSYGKYYLPLEYTSSTYMYVKNGDASEEKTAINQQDLMASKSLVETGRHESGQQVRGVRNFKMLYSQKWGHFYR